MERTNEVWKKIVGRIHYEQIKSDLGEKCKSRIREN